MKAGLTACSSSMKCTSSERSSRKVAEPGRRRGKQATTQPADHRRLSHEELTLVGRRPALGHVELQKLVQEVDGEADAGAVEDRLARPVENATELRAVDAGDDGPELVCVGGDIETAGF